MTPPKSPRLIWFLLGFLPVVACGIIVGAKAIPAIVPPTFTPVPSPTLAPTHTPTQVTVPTFTPTAVATPTPIATFPPTVVPDTGWESLQPGLERRTINMFNDDNHVEQLYLLRIDPLLYRFDVAYDEKAIPLAQWQAETNAMIVVNGGYFRVEDEKYIPNGLTVVDEQVIGSSFGEFAGMLAVTPYGPELRWLAQRPYDPNEILLAALQSFPVLVKPGGEIGFPAEHEDNKHARRTVIAQDQSGRILLVVTAKSYFTLHQLSVYLANSDLDVDIAINLDGGKSSGIILSNPYNDHIPALSSLPIVITVYAR